MTHKHYNFRSILAVILIMPLFIILMVEAAIIPFVEKQIMVQKEHAIRQVVDVAYGIVEDNEKQINKTRITLAEAQERAKSTLKGIRYNSKDYFWINDMGKPVPRMIMHPTEPFLDGKLLDDPRFNRATNLRYDLDGPENKLNDLNLFVAFTDVAEKAGNGYVTYYWAKPTLDGGITKELYRKLSYVKLFKPWGWVIGSGIYVDDVYNEAASLRTRVYSSTLILTIFLLVISYWFNSARRRQAEAEIRRLTSELEQRVIERTAQLEYANKELEAFSYSVSHDLRAPLRSIDGFSLALLEDYEEKLDEGGKDYLRRVRAATQRMAQLIDDILKLSLITRSELTFETVELSAIADSIADELRTEEPERKVLFVIKEGLTANGDPRLLKVVLDNLLGNAWKFTGAHAGARIEFGASDIEGKTAYFVRDDGAGFNMKYADKLFTTFQRLHSEQEFHGTGVGLALVQHIIHRHGGTVWAEGAEEQGATFYFTLG